MNFSKYQVTFFISVLSILLLINWGAPEPSIAGNAKQRVNFYGTLITRQGEKPLVIENISIGGKYRQISMFEKPAQGGKVQVESSKDGIEGKREIMLSANPKTDLVTTKIDLSEVSEILVPHPMEIWSYKREKSYRKLEYIELIIISNNEKKTKAHYLFEANIKVNCDEVNTAGPVEKEVPLPAIEKLIIDGYKFRVAREASKEARHAPCPCPCAGGQPKNLTCPVEKGK